MRLAVLSSIAAAFLLIGNTAIARVVFIDKQRYVWLEPTTTIDASQNLQVVNAVMPTESRRAIYERAFFTPEPNFQQAGYQCAGIVSVSFKGGVRHLHRGTYCIR